MDEASAVAFVSNFPQGVPCLREEPARSTLTSAYAPLQGPLRRGTSWRRLHRPYRPDGVGLERAGGRVAVWTRALMSTYIRVTESDIAYGEMEMTTTMVHRSATRRTVIVLDAG